MSYGLEKATHAVTTPTCYRVLQSYYKPRDIRTLWQSILVLQKMCVFNMY